MTAALVAVAVVSAPVLYVLAFRPVERRLALRYPVRRPVEAMLVVLGTLLGTAIITGSLIVGDTIDRSIRASAYDQLGPIDEVVAVRGLDEGAAASAAFAGVDSPVIDGIVSFATAPAAVQGQATQPRAQFIELDFQQGAAFGPDRAITGIEGDTPAPGRVVITTDLAERALLAPGDTLRAFTYGQLITLEVDRVVERTGLAGFWGLDNRQQSYNMLVAPGTLAGIVDAAPAELAEVEPPTVHIAFSNTGGVESGVDLTDQALAALAPVADELGASTRAVKRDLLDAATEAADGLTQLYFTMGMFAVAAGILLVVNIFVMLGDDRRSELGMLRAIGLKRFPLVGAFAAEGWVYSIVAGVLGAVVGIGVGWTIAWRADDILRAENDLNSLSLTFAFQWSTVVQGFAVGFVISLLTILFTTIRIGRMNVIGAIRNLPPVRLRHATRRWMVLGLVAVVGGVLWTVLAAGRSEGYGVAIGPMVAIAGLMPLLSARIGTRPAIAVVSCAELVWGTAFIPVLAAIDIEVGIPVFLVQGLAMAAAAVAWITAYQGVIARWVSKVTGTSLSVRLGLAYPVARRFRTAMTLGMFAVVILTLVYLSVISFMFRQQVDEIAADLSGGFGVVVTANPTNPPTVEDLSSVPGVGAIAPLTYGYADFVVGDENPQPWWITGIGPELVAAPPALVELGDYPDAQAAWEAVESRPDLIIVDEFFLSSAGGPATGTPEPGDSLTMIDPTSGSERTVTVAAWAEADFMRNGAYLSRAGWEDLTGRPTLASRFFVQPITDDSAVADTIRREFLPNGADAEAITDAVNSALAQQNGFFTLMQQFVGVGLVVGIAGIGVIMARAVRERRREVGVLRSLGFQPPAVARTFMVEAGFVAVEGTVIGVVVALIGSYGLVLSDSGFISDFQWGVSWTEVAVIVALSLGASTVAALWPARRASLIRPAEALRITD